MEAIQTTLYKSYKPSPIKRDSREKLIAVGEAVYFNRSGAVCFGTITDILRNEWKHVRIKDNGDKKWWSIKFELQVLAEDGKVSIVRNPNSFLIK